MQKILSSLNHDQRSVTPKHKLWLIRQRVAPMWSITNNNSTNTQQHGISELFLLPRSQQDEKHLSIFLYQAQNLQSLFFYLQKMESVCEIEAPHIALNSGLIWNICSTIIVEQMFLWDLKQTEILHNRLLTEVQSLL